MSENNPITYNDQLRLAFSDVDETIADVYTPAEPEMIAELSSYLQDGGKLFMVTGGSLARVQRDITDHIDPSLRHDILISHCSGAEVWGFTDTGSLRGDPFYSVYEETFTPEMKEAWREVIVQLVGEFALRTHPAQPKIDFWNTIGRDPLDIMLDDRGPQITMEVVNGIDLTDEQISKLSYSVPITHGKRDLRTAIKERSIELLKEANVPITPRFGGNFALDFAVEGVSKTTSIKSVLTKPEVLSTIGLQLGDVQNPSELEVWGDKFGINGGTDKHMSEALPPEVRSIDFREEDSSEFPEGYNIVVWGGKEHLHNGLLEYLQSRHKK
jgi:hydroxymethylpyrimidine pyrophosphatase-like HAD family hydrolase